MSSTQEAGEIFGAGKGPAHAMLRSPTVLIASVGLWGMNLFFFRLFRIDYVKVLKHDLLKMEESELELQESSKDTSLSVSHHRSGTSHSSQQTPTSTASQQPPAPSQQLTQRQPSTGVPLLAAVSGSGIATNQSSSPSQLLDEDEEEVLDEDDQAQPQHLELTHSHSESDNVISWQKLVGLSALLLVLLHSTYLYVP